MQAQKTDNNIKLNDSEECINFRPSPNFRHMRKYRKSKLEEENGSPCEEPPADNSDELERKPVKVMIQPPLPPNPPPPDTPHLTVKKLTLKKEIIDDEYENGQSIDQSETAMTEYKTEESTEKKTMCRDFARGSCTRPACRHAHEIILEQLPGIIIFCKNFQNHGCNRPKCRFIHATVFEKESFYRTGYLPPHTKAHLAVQPPPPPATMEVPQEMPLMYNNPPPAIVQPGPIAAVPVVECPPVAPVPPVAERRSIPDVLSTALGLTSPLKREWAELEEFNGSSRDINPTEPLVKKCKTCDVTEFRLQCSKNKVEKLMKTSEEMNKKMGQLIKKNNRLYTVLSLVKTSNVGAANPTNFLSAPSLNIIRNNDTESTVMDQLSMLLSGNNRVPSEEKNHLNSNLTSALLKLLLSTTESVSGDSS